MKQKIKNYITVLLLLVGLMFPSSCGKDFLNVVDPTVLDEANYPVNTADYERLMNDLYGRLREGFYSQYIRSILLIGKEIDTGYSGADFNEFVLNNLTQSLGQISTLWNNLFLHIAKCNDFITKIEAYKPPAAEEARVKQLVSEAKFIRALNYFQLINMYGEEPIHSAADLNKMGVPLWIDNATSIASAAKPRATQGEIYNQIIADLKAALPPLEALGNAKIRNQRPRIDQWTVKTLLAKTYIFTRDFSSAVPILKDIVDNSGKKLVPFSIYSNMFNGYNEFNDESIFEVNFARDLQSNSQRDGVGSVWNRYVSLTYFDKSNANTFALKDGKLVPIINGYSNFYFHDPNVARFGFAHESKDVQQDDFQNKTAAFTALKEYSLKVRADKSVDPRLFVNSMQPYLDSINLGDGKGWYPIAKGRCEGFDNTKIRAWNCGKYNNKDWVYVGNNAINFYVFRLAEVYLLYAEALKETGNDALALEYLNKVKRRAYDQPVDSPSPYDYTSLTDRTATLDPNDHLANDVLKYERWAELFMEGGWWFDVRRWDIGEQEVKYFKKTNPGTLVFNRKGFYAWPIPTAEMNANSLMVQNP